MKNRLQLFVDSCLRHKLIYKNIYTNSSCIPKLQNINLNMTLKESLQNKKGYFKAMVSLEMVSGQKPIAIKAKKSISNWKLRKNATIGAKVTLRNEMMFHFLDKLIHVVLPRDKEFQPFPCVIESHCDINNSTYSFGISDFFLFPELESQYEKFKFGSGFNIILNSNSGTKKEMIQLLSMYHLPFKK